MPSLKSLKVRIASVKSTQKITRALKTVAAAKLRRATEAAQAARPYAERMEAVLASLAARVGGSPDASPLLAGTGRDQTYLLVVCTSERGLAGGFNTNIARLARRRAEELIQAGKTVRFHYVGRKGRAQLIRLFRDAPAHNVDMSTVKTPSFDVARGIAEDILQRFSAGEFDVAELFYARFRSALVQEPVQARIIPAAVPALDASTNGVQADTEYEPDEESILADLLPRGLTVQIYRALLENQAGFFGAQMTAMDNATRNAGDAIQRLTLTYNRTRQAAITRELIEIISGAEAL